MWCVTWRYVARISATLPPILDEDFRYFPHSVKANGGIQLSRTRDRHFANLCLHTSFDASWTSSLKYGRASQQLGSMSPFCMSSRNVTNLNNTCPTRLQRLLPTIPSRSTSSRNITQSVVRTRSIKLHLLNAWLHWKTSRSLCGLKCASKTGTHSTCRTCFHSPVHGATCCLLSAVTYRSLDRQSAWIDISRFGDYVGIELAPYRLVFE